MHGGELIPWPRRLAVLGHAPIVPSRASFGVPAPPARRARRLVTSLVAAVAEVVAWLHPDKGFLAIVETFGVLAVAAALASITSLWLVPSAVALAAVAATGIAFAARRTRCV
jgi:hypothetical protein